MWLGFMSEELHALPDPAWSVHLPAIGGIGWNILEEKRDVLRSLSECCYMLSVPLVGTGDGTQFSVKGEQKMLPVFLRQVLGSINPAPWSRLWAGPGTEI